MYIHTHTDICMHHWSTCKIILGKCFEAPNGHLEENISDKNSTFLSLCRYFISLYKTSCFKK